jgi:hypothetical protein
VLKEYIRLCSQAELAHAPCPPGCNRRVYDGLWRPGGNLLRDMRDPDRPHSSVPDRYRIPFPECRAQLYGTS